jgi:CyaY protein
MSDSLYRARADAVFNAIEARADAYIDEDIDIDCERNGDLLTLTFTNGSKIIMSLQKPLEEIWVATQAGGFHYGYRDGEWRDKRGDTLLFDVLSRHASEQAGVAITFIDS